MSDIFSEDYESSDIFGGESGSSPTAEPVTPVNEEPAAAQAAPASTDGTATATGQGATGGEADIFEQTQAPAPSGDGGQQQPADDAAQKLEQEAKAALADPRTPKWYKNYVENVYQPKLAEFGQQVERYSAFGTPEELSSKLDLINSLHEVTLNQETMLPERSTKGFVDALYQEDPGAAYQLLADLAQLESPVTPGMTVTQELLKQVGIDPSRLEDIKQFAANGYSTQASAFAPPAPEDLAEIPDQYKSTFSQLDPETREDLMASSERVRNSNLEGHRVRLEKESQDKMTQEQKDANDQQEKDNAQREFAQRVTARGQQFFVGASEKVLNAFTDSLAKQAGMSKMDTMMVVNTVLNTLNPNTLEGRLSLEALKAEGIDLDPAIPGLLQQLEQKTQLAASYELTGDRNSLNAVGADILDIQQSLQAKGNKVIAALASKRANGSVQPAQELNGQLAKTENTRHALAGAASTGVSGGTQPRMDFSDESYFDDLQHDPHFVRRR